MSNKKCKHEVIRNVFPGYEENYIKSAKERNIFLTEDVTKETGSDMVAWLLYYDNVDHEDPITLYIHSSGGDSSALVQIYDAIQMIQAPVRTICLGKAYSAGAILLAIGAEGERYAMEHSEVMIHGLQCAFPIPGFDVDNSKNYYEFLNEHNDIILKILAKHTNNPFEKVKADCQKDIYMTAKEALSYGIIDGII